MQTRGASAKYILIAGPGRSGSAFLCQLLGKLPGCRFVGDERAYLYRKPLKLLKLLKGLTDGQVICDAATRAFRDRQLPAFCEFLKGHPEMAQVTRIIYLYRDPLERFLSIHRFRASRGQLAAYLPSMLARKLMLRDTLTVADFAALRQFELELGCIMFRDMVEDGNFPRNLAQYLGFPRLENTLSMPAGKINEARRPRLLPLASLASLSARLLRGLGLLSLLNVLKSSRTLQALIFSGEKLRDASLADWEAEHLRARERELTAFLAAQPSPFRGYAELRNFPDNAA